MAEAESPVRKRKVVVASSVDPDVAAILDQEAADRRGTTSSVIRSAVHFYLRSLGHHEVPEQDMTEPEDEEQQQAS